MAQYRKHSLASALALGVGLTACGGGGGGRIASIPPPPPATALASIGAAALPPAPNASLFPQATEGGPTMQAHPTTAFPLLQTVMTIDGSSARADRTTMTDGATLAFDYSGAEADDQISLTVPGLGLTDFPLTAGGGYYCTTYCGQVGDTYAELEFDDPATSNLNWTTYGSWYSFAPQTRTLAKFVTGYATPAAAVPTTGTATFSGSAQGTVLYPDPAGQSGIGGSYISGDASLQADFANGSMTGSLTNMTSGSGPWNSVSLLGAISGGQNYFSGTSAATSAPGTNQSLNGSATGTFAGMFFGPAAQELGAVWTLSDGKSTAFGTIAAKSGP